MCHAVQFGVLLAGDRADQRDTHHGEHRDHERHEVEDRRHDTQGRPQAFGARLRLGDELVGKGLGEGLEQGLHLDATASEAQLDGETHEARMSALLSSGAQETRPTVLGDQRLAGARINHAPQPGGHRPGTTECQTKIPVRGFLVGPAGFGPATKRL
jgi:hypothetical protein